jgi:D-hexose-6-phosphate mutarotase
MEIELFEGSTIAKISKDGGYVTNLADQNGDIFYPKRTITAPDGSQKVRGGSHICLPNFGPGGDSGQPQHGFARLSAWDVISQTDSAVTLGLAGDDAYAGVELRLTYVLEASSLNGKLEVNNGATGDIAVAPAFHPYFMIGGGVEIDGAIQPNLTDYAEAVCISGTKHILRTNGRLMTLMSTSLSTWAIWTDRLAPYLCIEPTQSGFSFEEDITRADTIKPGETRQYDLSIDWAIAP